MNVRVGRLREAPDDMGSLEGHRQEWAQGVTPALTPLEALEVMPNTLARLGVRLISWLEAQALPLWYSLGADHDRGGFFEMLDQTAHPVKAPRRVRVQPRQSYVFAQAARHGWAGPAKAASQHGLAYLHRVYRRDDGLYRTLIGPDGETLDEGAMIYDQAFVLLALASTREETLAIDLWQRMQSRRHTSGGFREDAAQPFQSNPHMHLFEAALAWVEAGGVPLWTKLADEMATLALTRFIDKEGGFVREFFDADWHPATGIHGRRIEPGHQFEWAWLLARWSRITGNTEIMYTAERLLACGLRGVDRKRGVAVDALYDDYGPMEDQARLWPQAEWLKAALILNRPELALPAARALTAYLQTPVNGLWRDKMSGDGRFVDEAAPASSLYHIASAIWELASRVRHRSATVSYGAPS